MYCLLFMLKLDSYNTTPYKKRKKTPHNWVLKGSTTVTQIQYSQIINGLFG